VSLEVAPKSKLIASLTALIAIAGVSFLFLASIWSVRIWNGVNVLPEKFAEQNCFKTIIPFSENHLCSIFLSDTTELPASTVPKIKRRLHLGIYRGEGIETNEADEGSRLIRSEVAKFCAECVQMDRLDGPSFTTDAAAEFFYRTGRLEGVGISFGRALYSTPAILKTVGRGGPSYRKRLVDQGSFPIINPQVRPNYAALYKNIGGRRNAVVFLPPNLRCNGVTQLLVDQETSQVIFANPLIYSERAYIPENIGNIVACITPYFQPGLPIAEIKVPFFYFLDAQYGDTMQIR
jgi:hypothetical protein